MIAIRLVGGRRVTIQAARSCIRLIRSSSVAFQAEVAELSSTIAIDTGAVSSIDTAGPDAYV